MQDSKEHEKIHKLASRVLAEERPGSYGHEGKMKVSETVSITNVSDANAGSAYLIEDALAAMMIPHPYNYKPCCNSRMTLMKHTMV